MAPASETVRGPFFFRVLPRGRDVEKTIEPIAAFVESVREADDFAHTL